MLTFFPDGSITPCCGTPTPEGYYGNIFTDYFEPLRQNKTPSLFVSNVYKDLRRQLLTGSLQEACRNCRIVSAENIKPETLQKKVQAYLHECGLPLSDGDNLAEKYFYTGYITNITDKCNFTCIYCFVHSNDKKSATAQYMDMDRQHFIDSISLLSSNGLKDLTLACSGELTTYPKWHDLCVELFDSHPTIQINLISNFGRIFSEAELEVLTRFHSISISCDTVDPKTYSWLRRGGRLSTLLQNIHNLRSRCAAASVRVPILAFNITLSDVIVDKLIDLARHACAHDMSVNFSNLSIIKGSVVDKTGCISRVSDMPQREIPHVWEIFQDLPRRMKSENPKSDVWDFGSLYYEVKRIAESITLNRFLPTKEELIYQTFYQLYPQRKSAYLRKIFLSFDHYYKGIYLDVNDDDDIVLDLPYRMGTIRYRIIWCKERRDGNLTVIPSQVAEVTTGQKIRISAHQCIHNDMEFDHVLFEVLSYFEAVSDSTCSTTDSIEFLTPANTSQATFIRETLLCCDADKIIQTLISSQEPLAIWCAGARTNLLFDKTCLCIANIKMIIDSNPDKQGCDFHGFRVSAPDKILSFDGVILVTHATSPYDIETNIRDMGVKNEILII
jgi:hypothetical protein